MNLASRDIRHQWARFVATGFGLGLLFAVVLAMGGIYRGMIEDATLLVRHTEADLWIVQRGTRGPFAERSSVDARLERRAHAIPGVAWARPFSSLTLEPSKAGRPLRISFVGLAWPEDRGEGLPLLDGRALRHAHREIIADASLGLALGDTIDLGGESYEVVGIGRGLVSSGGDGLAFVTNADVEQIQAYVSPEELRIAKASGAASPAANPSAVIVRVRPGASVESVRDRLAAWSDVSVYTRAEQEAFLVESVIDKARRQIGLFRALLSIVSGLVVSLVIFNMTVGKTREIALLKLMGAKLGVVVGMILQQSLLLTLLAYVVALAVSQLAFPYFPRRVVIGGEEIALMFVLAVTIGLVASVAAIHRALRIPPTTILAG